MNTEKLKEELFEQIGQNGEQTIDELNETSELVEQLFNTDESILQSYADMEKSLDSSTIKNNATDNTKKSMSVLADEIVRAFLDNRTEQNWKKLQEFFWYGIRQFATKIVDDWDDAYDMTIDTFIRAYEAIDSYDPNKARFSTWLWRICRNNCLHFLLQKKKLPMIDNDIADIYDSEIFNGVISNEVDALDFKLTAENTLEDVLSTDLTEQLYNVSINEMDNIDGIGQTILKMKLIKNMKIREISKELNMNESTVKNYLYRSKENLSRLVKANHSELYKMYIDAKSIENFEY